MIACLSFDVDTETPIRAERARHADNAGVISAPDVRAARREAAGAARVAGKP